MMDPIRHLFWDFDGTLYDSYPQLLRSVMLALKENGVAHLFTDAEVLRLIKVNVYHGIVTCSEKAGISTELLMNSYHRYHQQEMNFVPYEGMETVLKALHAAGFHHYLYTHRDAGAVRQLQSDGLWELFSDSVIKEDGFPAKPAPDALRALMLRNHLTPGQCAMVGDRDIDIEAGHNAGMKGFLFDPDGFYQNCPADLHIKRLTDLPSIFCLKNEQL